jgi:hypothetical protein
MKPTDLIVIVALVSAVSCCGVASAGFDSSGNTVTIAQASTPDQPGSVAAPVNSPEAKWAKRYPQKATVRSLIGLPVLNDDDVTLGHVQEVVRTPAGKVKLIVSYSRWFGYFGRPVAVPIEVVAILARQIDSIDMEPPDYDKAPTWVPGEDKPIPRDETVLIALGRR